MKQVTECTTTIRKSPDVILDILGIEGKIKSIQSRHWMTGFHMFELPDPKRKIEHHEDVQIVLQPVKTNSSGNDITECNKTVTLDESEFIKKLDIDGKIESIDLTGKNEVTIVLQTITKRNE